MNWTLEKEIFKEAKYSSGDWSLEKVGSYVSVSHSSLVYFPMGSGADEKAAFEDMIRSIEKYKATLDSVKAEAEAHLAELEGEENA